jgi:dCTP deaminase
MILSGSAIGRYIASGLISIEPEFDAQQLRPFGLRVHLSNEILVPSVRRTVDLSSSEDIQDDYRKDDITEHGLVLTPGDFVLASTVEAIRVDSSLCCRLDGRSTLARLGVMVHCTSDTIDNNQSAHRAIILEIANIGPHSITIPSQYAIGMLIFYLASDSADPQYEQDQYAGQLGVMGPNLRFQPPAYSFVSGGKV